MSDNVTTSKITKPFRVKKTYEDQLDLVKVCFLQPTVNNVDVIKMIKLMEANKWDYKRTPMEFVRFRTPNMQDDLLFAIGNRRGSSLVVYYGSKTFIYGESEKAKQNQLMKKQMEIETAHVKNFKAAIYEVDFAKQGDFDNNKNYIFNDDVSFATPDEDTLFQARCLCQQHEEYIQFNRENRTKYEKEKVKEKSFWACGLSALTNMCEERVERIKRKVTDVIQDKGEQWIKNFGDKMKVTIEEFTEKFFTERPEILVDNQKQEYLIKNNKKI